MVVYSRGVGLIFDVKWPVLLRRAAYTTYSTFLDTFDTLNYMYLPLLNGLAQSTSLQYEYVLHKRRQFFMLISLLASFMIAFLLLMLITVLEPFVRFLAR